MISRILRLIGLVILLAGCGQSQVLYSNLTEREAAGLSSEKIKLNSKSAKHSAYEVTTKEASFANAMMLLQANGLPRERFAKMADVFQNTGPVSSALEETAKLNYALSESLSATLSRIDGVSVARVHLAIPKNISRTREAQASSAAVFIKHRANVSLGKDLTKIKALVVDSIENLEYADVTVVFFAEKQKLDSTDSKLKNPLIVPVQTPSKPLTMHIMGSVGWIGTGLAILLTAMFSYLLINTNAKLPHFNTKTNFEGRE